MLHTRCLKDLAKVKYMAVRYNMSELPQRAVQPKVKKWKKKKT
jgi:hypothetical protein